MFDFINQLIFFAGEHIQGTEMEIPGLYITGHPPAPPEKVYAVAYISAGILFILAVALQYFLKKHLLKPKNTGESETENPPPVKYRTFKTVLIVLMVVLFYFLSLEAALQVYVYYNPYQKFIPDPTAGWKINPNIQRYYQNPEGVDPKDLCEMDGLLDWEYTRFKEPDAYRILVYGDSQTMATPWVGDINLTFPKLLQEKLRKAFPGKKIEVINMGVSGYSSVQGLLFFKNIGLLYNPDCVIVGLGFHDAGQSSAPDKDITSDNPWVKKLRTLLYRSQIYLLIRKKILRRRVVFRDVLKNNRPIYRRVSKEDYRENLKTFKDIGKKNNLLIVFMTVPQVGFNATAHADYVNVMRKAAEDFKVIIIDTAKSMSGFPLKKQEEYFVKDKVHFNYQGNEFMAEQIYEVIQPVLLKKEFKESGNNLKESDE
ncbi:MAG: SGNH/GDSL hydrolase family protein [Candidatus Eremiobacteraeota bacterium]|nr:SGNH/GDSL hydrolase family protein [Candidatus Eremiobacteraeota bacterium]